MNIEFHLSEEDFEKIRLIIREEVIKALATGKDSKLYTRQEACTLLKISLPTLHTWRKKKLINCTRIQNRVLVSEREINRILLLNEQPNY